MISALMGRFLKPWNLIFISFFGLFIIVYGGLAAGTKTFSHDAVLWFGSFHYYLEHMKNGEFPYWDPYMLTGTYFYPNISGYGLLDPFVLICTGIYKFAGVSTLTLFNWLRLYRLLVFITGAYYLYKRLSGSPPAALVASGVLLFAIMPVNSFENTMDYCFTVPLGLYCMLRIMDAANAAESYRYLAALGLVTGITLNVFIPSAYLFALVCFFVVSLSIGRRGPSALSLKVYATKRGVAFVLLVGLLVLFMAAPPVTLKLSDASAEGELFPIGRLTDNNNYIFKKMFATEVGEDVFSESLTGGDAAFVSFLDVMTLITPVPEDVKRIFIRYYNGISFYFGMVPVIVCILGMSMLRFRGRGVAAIMLALVFICLFSYDNKVSQYNVLQKLLNIIFPPLRMIDTRINFISLAHLFLCMIFSLVLAEVLSGSRLALLAQRHYKGILAFCAALIVIKTGLSAVFFSGTLLAGWFDAAVMLIVIFFAAHVYLFGRRMITRKVFMTMTMLLLLTDLGLYSNHQAIRERLHEASLPQQFLMNKAAYREFSVSESMRGKDGFEYFRLPRQANELITAFEETLIETKGSFPTDVFSAIFMTRRYYDLFTNLEPGAQMGVNGVYFPIIRFYPEDKVKTDFDKRKIIEYFGRTAPGRMADVLFIEKEGRQIMRPLAKMGDYQDVNWFRSGEYLGRYQEMIPSLKEVRMNIDRYLSNEFADISVKDFRINEININVRSKRDGYLLYNDGWSRHWRAFDKGGELPVLIANYNSKAVFLDKGIHEVRFIFDPAHYKTALVLYYTSLAAFIVLIGFILSKNIGGRTERL
ncbi:MAG: hypothetical protein HZB33_05950 [Nitrospirae bacterium]|nr:hypothetical protein [Nitrospirota bacterium]